MARVTGPQKTDRILRFLLALRDDAVAGPLVAAGFRDADLEEGWSLLRKLGPHSLAEVSAPEEDPIAPAMIELEKWARRYIRVLEPAVARKHPKLREFLFGGLDALRGIEVVITIQHYLKRVGSLSKRAGGAAARKLLESRGLTDAEMARVRPHLATVKGKGIIARAAKLPTKRPDYAFAERKAWAWYLDWTGVARATINDGRILRRLGFSARGRRGEADPAAPPEGE